ncbi:hypothetical protein [Actinomadura alba]|uniref:DUF5666 domain-containing protein n=1 Tax=Actinomadura alba TaxID=406431 RepID=A0ABR7LT77_9ACTN|nr:hypothetical protein [Actinomadura alba]MBC6468052.1 hypothetical protein [Actinomadura alba]
MSTMRRKPTPEPEPDRPAVTDPGAEADGAPGGRRDMEVLATSPFDDDLEAELAARPRRAGPAGLTLCLGAALVAVAGFIAGIQANKTWGGEDSAARSPFEAAAGAARGQAGGQAGPGAGGPGGGQAGPGGFGGQGGQRPGGGPAAGGGVTAGTVQRVSGDTIYLQTASGQVVKVTTNGSTKVRVTKDGALRDVKSGSSVVVQGTPGQDGTVTATNIAEGGAFGGLRQRPAGDGTP